MTMRKKLLITIACLSVVLCTLVTGTLAWLISTSGPITNTFTPSNVKVGLTEDNNGVNNVFQMIPGKTYAKDPTVTVTTDIDCYVFVKVVKSNNFDYYMTCAVDTDNWKLVDGYTDVYYYIGSSYSEPIHVLKDDKVTINPALTMEDMSGFYNTDGSRNDVAAPTLTFKAYAIQREGFSTPALAWAEASK